MALVGYRNLEWLKARLLPADLGDASDYDADLSNIGLAVAASFDDYTGRKMRRAVADPFTVSGGVESIVASRYPIEAITAAVLVTDGSETDITDSIVTIHHDAGIVIFAGEMGSVTDLIRLTITGGYWCEDGAEAMPSGATPLPDSILGAWVQQVRAVCEAENTFRAKGAERPDKKTAGPVTLDTLDLMSGVKKALQTQMRFC